MGTFVIDLLSGKEYLFNGNFVESGSTITCAADSAKLNNKLPAYYLNTGSTALCATTAGNALALCGCTPACFLGVNACAVDSAKLNNKSASFYLNTGSTSINSLALCGCVPSCFLGVNGTAVCATCAISAKALCGCVPASFLLSGGTAVCATCSVGSKGLCGCVPSCFLGATSTACCAVTAGNALCLGGVLPAGYLPTNSNINTLSCTCYAIQASDCGKIVEFTTTASTTIWLPTGLTVGMQFDVVNVGGGNKTFCQCTNATIHSLCSNVILAGSYNMASVYLRCTNNYVLVGNLC